MGTCKDILDTIYYLIVDIIPVIVKPTTYSNNTRVGIYALSTMHYFLVVEVFYSVESTKTCEALRPLSCFCGVHRSMIYQFVHEQHSFCMELRH